MKESDYILLLHKRFAEEITSEESFMLDEWLGQSAKNEQIAKDMHRIWLQAEGYGKTFTPNLDADFQKVRAKIQTSAPVQLRATLGQKLMRAAAVLVLAIAAVWGWTQFAGPDTTAILVSAETIGKQSATLPDGSKYWLREGSQLAYAKAWNGKERRVKLLGEAYFEVQHDPAHPFKVELENGGTVEVLGTQFDVCQVENQTSVLVRSGKVRFSPTAQTTGPVLTANQKAVFDHNAAQVRVVTLPSLNELAWQTGGLEFVNTPLDQVVSDLERYYGVKITLRNPAMSSCPHSAPLTSQPIDKVLETLALTHQLKVKRSGERNYELSGGSCR